MNLMEKYRSKLGYVKQDAMAVFLGGLNEEERFTFEERAAIMEYDGGLTREEAERQAVESIMKGKTT